METNNKHIEVVLLYAENISDDFIVFRRKTDHRGNYLTNQNIETSDNPTYISNLKLMNSGNASTNSLCRYYFYDFYFFNYNEKPVIGDYVYDPCLKNKILKITEDDLEGYQNFGKIIGTTNTSSNLPKPNDKFIDLYNSNNKFNQNVGYVVNYINNNEISISNEYVGINDVINKLKKLYSDITVNGYDKDFETWIHENL